MLLRFLTTLGFSRHFESAISTNIVPGRDFVWIRKLLKHSVTTVGTILTSVGVRFSDCGVFHVGCRTVSKDW